MREKYGAELAKTDDVEELMLDSLMPLDELSTADKAFLEKFSSLSFLSMNGLGLKSVKNLPNIPGLITVNSHSQNLPCHSLS